MKTISTLISGAAVVLMFTVIGCGGGSSKLNKKTVSNGAGNNVQGTGSNQNISPTGGSATLADLKGAWVATSYTMTDSSTGKTFEAIGAGYRVGALIDDQGKALFGVIDTNKDPNKANYSPGTLTDSGSGQLSLNGHSFNVSSDGTTMTWTGVYFADTVSVDIVWRPYDTKSDTWPQQ